MELKKRLSINQLIDYKLILFTANKCTVYNELIKSPSTLFDNKFYRWVDSSDPSKFPMIGPTALIRQVLRGINDKTLVSLFG
jgi:hypothetical protein